MKGSTLAISLLLLQVVNYSDAVVLQRESDVGDDDEAENAVGTCPPGLPGLLVLLPHKYDCTKYFSCRTGKPVLQTCPILLYFDPTLGLCVIYLPDGCESEEEPSEEEVDWVGECPVPDTDPPTLLPHKCDCTKYFKCNDEKPVLEECEEDQHFNPDTPGCEDVETDECELAEKDECKADGTEEPI